MKDTERLRRCSENPVLLSSVELSTPLPKDMDTFWSSNENKVLLEKLLYEYVRHTLHKDPTVLSQICVDNDQWQCLKLHNGKEDIVQHLQSEFEEADLRIIMHVLDCTREGYKTCTVLSNDTDVIVALLFHLSTFL